MNKMLCSGIVAIALSAAPALGAAQTATSKRASIDKAFVTKAAQGGMAEVELGKLAVDKGSSSEVKQFGQKMVEEHGKANDQLKSLAANKNMTLPTALTPKDKALEARLSKLAGPAFDRAYMRAMVTDHRQDVNEFKMESKSGADADIKSWASNTLPTLETHLKMAQDANRAVGTSGVKK